MGVSAPAAPSAASLRKSSLGRKVTWHQDGSSLLAQHSVALSPSLFPGLWGLVNIAGISTPTAPSQWLSKQDFVKILDMNLLGMIDVTLSLPPLVQNAKGHVVDVFSVMVRQLILRQVDKESRALRKEKRTKIFFCNVLS